jgi:hypothetical protein
MSCTYNEVADIYSKVGDLIQTRCLSVPENEELTRARLEKLLNALGDLDNDEAFDVDGTLENEEEESGAVNGLGFTDDEENDDLDSDLEDDDDGSYLEDDSDLEEEESEDEDERDRLVFPDDDDTDLEEDWV